MTVTFLKIGARRVRMGARIAAAIGCLAGGAQADGFTSPDILVLGDSQITFGSGEPYLDFMSNLDQRCSPSARDQRLLDSLGDLKIGVLGVRSTSLHSWVARKGAAKGSVCDVDKTWGVNAGSYGILNSSKNIYVQMGKGANYQFCTPGKSPFEAMLRPDYYTPKLLFLTFLGNASKRWANDPATAVQDVQRMVDQLPRDVPCVFMTTAPGYTQKINDRRVKAQAAVKAAFAKTGGRCTFVEGLTPAMIKSNQGTARHFRRRENGSVKDPFHPNKRAARKMFEIENQAICSAVFTELRKATRGN